MDEQLTRLLTMKEAARILGVHPLTIKRWNREGKVTLVFLPVGNRPRITQEEVNRLMQQTKVVEP